MLNGEIEKITKENIGDIICCPDGLEVRDKNFSCDLSPVLKWKKEMFEYGMNGLVLYQEGEATGFVEYMPVEKAPYPIEGKNFGVIMCFHWVSKEDSEDHLKLEKELLKAAMEEMKKEFNGAAALAWDNPEHFPIDLFKDVGYSKVSFNDHIYLMWKPFDSTDETPEFIETSFQPEDLSKKGKLAIELGYSNRCPYSIRDREKVEDAVSRLNDERIIFHSYEIDRKEKAGKFLRGDWNWLYLNGAKIDHMWKSREDLEDIVKKKLERL